MKYVATLLTKANGKTTEEIKTLEAYNPLDALKSVCKIQIPMFSNQRRGYWFANAFHAGLVDLKENLSIDIQTEANYFKVFNKD
jgi:hypothetical protein